MPPKRTSRTPRRLIHKDVRTQARKDGTYDRLYTEQAGTCPLCDRIFPVLDIDHSHGTLEIRGLLCRGCNLRLGRESDPAWLRRAANYLEGQP